MVWFVFLLKTYFLSTYSASLRNLKLVKAKDLQNVAAYRVIINS